MACRYTKWQVTEAPLYRANLQWPDFQLYFPDLLKLALGGDRRQLLVRVDYDLTRDESLSPVPSLQSQGIFGYKHTGESPLAGQEVEAVVGYWMGLAPP